MFISGGGTDADQFSIILEQPKGASIIVEGLTGKIGTFLLADLWLRYHYDMTV